MPNTQLNTIITALYMDMFNMTPNTLVNMTNMTNKAPNRALNMKRMGVSCSKC